MRAFLITCALFNTAACAHGSSRDRTPPPVGRSADSTPSQWERFAPPEYGACDERNGPCPARSLRVELRWSTPGTDLDLHAIAAQNLPHEQFWFTIADAHWFVPEPRLIFSGTHRLAHDATAPGDVEVIESSHGALSELLVAVHFFNDALRARTSDATVTFVCDHRPYARVRRTLVAGTQGERSNDFWKVASVRLTPGQGCAVTPIDTVHITADLDLYHQWRARPPER